MAGIAADRLRAERKAWRKSHPIGFYARASKNTDGSSNLFEWQCGVPGKYGTPYEGGLYKLTIKFTEDYPNKAPDVRFTPLLWHMNIWTNGKICLNILNENDGTWHGKWMPTTTIPEILMAVQQSLNEPNPKCPARMDIHQLYSTNRAEYDRRVLEEAKKFPAD
jgi:ubiquitin-conjugating enzyme E2 I